ncbi:aminopeptidase [Wukongibacter baidiensis]|uniref:aminopeptidase n=1 Tax=Wukongibacter baidiensis TaxID=1723361 RepID=UPI003D7FE27B
MPKVYEYELAKVAKKMIEDMFQVKPGETVAITADSGTNEEIVDALAKAAYAVGGKPLVMWVARPRGEGQEAMPDLPAAALTGALCEVDVWIEIQSRFMLYSDVFETAFEKNKKLRYVIVYDATIEQLKMLVGDVNIPLLGKLLRGVRDLVTDAKTIRVKNARGTDVTFEMDPKHLIDMDDGIYNVPKFGTLPGYVNVVPRFETMEGTIVFDELMGMGILKDDRVEFTMKEGKIVEFKGGKKAEEMKAHVESFDDPNMFKISHMMISLNPGVRSLTGSVVTDERIWGGVDFGFGHTSPMDAPPNGQPAKSHFDGILEKTSIWFDDVQITDNGVVCHPEIKGFAEELLAEME